MSPTGPLPAERCPICGKPAREAAKPFCSTRCANVDLHRWLSGAYAVPDEESEGADEIARIDGADDEV